jgi:cytochrome c
MRTAAAFALLTSAGLLAAGLVGAGPPPAAQIEQGREIYERCAACHSLERDRVGPRHCGLFGRRAGSVPGFPYSDAMRDSGIVWSWETLDRFIADPLGTVPGTFMGYAGVPDAEERAQLLAYLEAANRSEQCVPGRGSMQEQGAGA